MNNKLVLSPYDINNIRDSLDLFKGNAEIIGSSVFRVSSEYMKKNYQLQSVQKLLEFFNMASAENRSQQGDIYTEIIMMTNEVEK